MDGDATPLTYQGAEAWGVRGQLEGMEGVEGMEPKCRENWSSSLSLRQRPLVTDFFWTVLKSRRQVEPVVGFIGNRHWIVLVLCNDGPEGSKLTKTSWLCINNGAHQKKSI